MREVDGRRMFFGVVVRRGKLVMMSVQEIKKVIEQEKRRVKRTAWDIRCAKDDIRATRKAIKFWEGELKKAKSNKR